jgi:hypothetical protein
VWSASTVIIGPVDVHAIGPPLEVEDAELAEDVELELLALELEEPEEELELEVDELEEPEEELELEVDELELPELLEVDELDVPELDVPADEEAP